MMATYKDLTPKQRRLQRKLRAEAFKMRMGVKG
jgi:hypothetical protein